MQLLAANRTKKGYYTRRVKDALWSVFGINRIIPYKDNWSKQKIKEWKRSEMTRKAYNDLYIPSDPEDDGSDTYLAVIIKAVFPSTKERTHANATWTQAVMESIFDMEHISTKIDSEIVDNCTETLTDTELVNT
jgi:hypothetical protein